MKRSNVELQIDRILVCDALLECTANHFDVERLLVVAGVRFDAVRHHCKL